MRTIHVLLASAAIAASTTAQAADQLKFGKAPAWVVPQAIPLDSGKNSEAPVALLLADQQIELEPGKTVRYGEIAMKIQTPEGLAAGNISLPWNPATDTVTVNKLEIHRGKQVINVLAGQTFTTMRRESNLELATLDGVLTANIQPDGLQQGDIIDFATTTEHADPVFGKHVEATFAQWQGQPINLAHLRLEWPSSMNVSVRTSGGLPPAQPITRSDRKVLEITEHDVEPAIPPKGAPLRFKLGRFGEASDFASWADVAKTMIPLFQQAETIPSSGPLHDEVEKIRAATTDPATRAIQALQLVQQRVRYVALLMGQGSYVPTKAETTWSQRFGDCKAKTALLLGILHSLRIDAEPVLANITAGDVIADRLPAVSLFDHVLVRAHIGGKDYWLDGTRTGDTELASIETPDFGWALPLTEHAQLVHLVPAPLNKPSMERQVTVDASNGVFAPVPVTIDEIYRGDSAVGLNGAYAALTASQRNEQMSDEAKNFFDTFTVATSSVDFDKAKRKLHITIKGTAKLNWKDGWLFVPTSTIGFDPDFDRTAGPLHDVAWAVAYPRFVKDRATIRLPAGFAAQQKLDPAVHETLAGVEYARSETVSGDVLTVDSSERSIEPEVPYKAALAAASRLRTLVKDDVYLAMVASYRTTDADLAEIAQQTPGSASDYVRRGSTFLNAGKLDQAIADFSEALSTDPKNLVALASRANAYVWKHQFDKSSADLKAASAIDPDDNGVLSAEALQAEFQHNYARAVELYTKALASQPSNDFLHGHRAICEQALGQSQSSLADSEIALKGTPTWINLRVLRANIMMLAGQRDGVAAEADAMTKENPDSDYAFVAAAKTYAALGERDRAMQAFARALEIKPQAYIYINRSEIRPRSDITGRTTDLDAALKLDPDNGTALAEKAELLAQTHDFKGALALLDRAKPNADNDSTKTTRAVLLYELGRTTDSKAVFDSLRKSATADELNELCWAKATHGILLDSALQDCRDALKINPNDGAYLDSLGMVLLKLGKLDEARAAYDQAIAKRVGANSLMGRAFVYLRAGDIDHAKADAASARKMAANIDEIFTGYGLSFDAGSSAGAAGSQMRTAAKH